MRTDYPKNCIAKKSKITVDGDVSTEKWSVLVACRL